MVYESWAYALGNTYSDAFKETQVVYAMRWAWHSKHPLNIVVYGLFVFPFHFTTNIGLRGEAPPLKSLASLPTYQPSATQKGEGRGYVALMRTCSL